MRYNSAEDRLNPTAPEGTDDTTLGGYLAIHGRAAAFEGMDGQPYTVAVETEGAGDDPGTWTAYLIFLRWAGTGTAVMDHLESADLVRADSEAEARAMLEAFRLVRVKAILDDTILRRQADPEP